MPVSKARRKRIRTPKKITIPCEEPCYLGLFSSYFTKCPCLLLPRPQPNLGRLFIFHLLTAEFVILVYSFNGDAVCILNHWLPRAIETQRQSQYIAQRRRLPTLPPPTGSHCKKIDTTNWKVVWAEIVLFPIHISASRRPFVSMGGSRRKSWSIDVVGQEIWGA